MYFFSSTIKGMFSVSGISIGYVYTVREWIRYKLPLCLWSRFSIRYQGEKIFKTLFILAIAIDQHPIFGVQQQLFIPNPLKILIHHNLLKNSFLPCLWVSSLPKIPSLHAGFCLRVSLMPLEIFATDELPYCLCGSCHWWLVRRPSRSLMLTGYYVAWGSLLLTGYCATCEGLHCCQVALLPTDSIFLLKDLYTAFEFLYCL